MARALNRGERKEVPLEAPIQFIPAAWRSASKRDDGTIDRSLWEIALALAVRDALRSGDLYLPESRRHVSFWNLLTDECQWTEQRESAYAALALPSEADRVLKRLAREFDEVAWRTERGLGGNPFAAVRDGRLHLKRPDALEIPQRVEELRRLIETHLPRVRIENLLGDVDSWCGFLGAFCPVGGYQSRSDNLDVALPAALIAHGTNLGIAAMGHSAEGVTVDMLQHVSRWFLREETLRVANTVLVDYHNRLDLSSVWGDGTRSSSDGQQFWVRASSLLGLLYPRYFGYYDRAVTVYTHTSDQFSVFGSRAIFCSSARPCMCSTACWRTTRSCGRGSIRPTRTAIPSISSGSVTSWASASCRGCGAWPISSCTRSTGVRACDSPRFSSRAGPADARLLREQVTQDVRSS